MSSSYNPYTMFQCTLQYVDGETSGLDCLTDQDKQSLGLVEKRSYEAEASLAAVANGTAKNDTKSTWRTNSNGNMPVRDWVMQQLRGVQPFAAATYGFYLDPLNKYVWFWVRSVDIEAVLGSLSEPDNTAPAAPIPWFKTPNGKRYLDEWRNGRLQAGTYVFADAGKSVRCVDSSNPVAGDPIQGSVLFCVHSPCAFIVRVDPGILLAPSGIGDIV